MKIRQKHKFHIEDIRRISSQKEKISETILRKIKERHIIKTIEISIILMTMTTQIQMIQRT